MDHFSLDVFYVSHKNFETVKNDQTLNKQILYPN